MAIIPVQPSAGNASQIAVGGSAVNAVLANVAGGTITNPLTAEDQGIAPAAAEALYVDFVTTAQLEAYGTTFRLEPGQSITLIPGSNKAVSVNAATTGHRFTVTSWTEV